MKQYLVFWGSQWPFCSLFVVYINSLMQFCVPIYQLQFQYFLNNKPYSSKLLVLQQQLFLTFSMISVFWVHLPSANLSDSTLLFWFDLIFCICNTIFLITVLNPWCSFFCRQNSWKIILLSLPGNLTLSAYYPNQIVFIYIIKIDTVFTLYS